MKQCADKGRRVVEFSVGQDVLQSTKCLWLSAMESKRDITRKLFPTCIGPFTSAKAIRKAAYHLGLSSTSLRVHPVFHVSLLKPYTRTEGVVPPLVPTVLGGISCAILVTSESINLYVRAGVNLNWNLWRTGRGVQPSTTAKHLKSI